MMKVNHSPMLIHRASAEDASGELVLYTNSPEQWNMQDLEAALRDIAYTILNSSKKKWRIEITMP